jgi:4-hydroxy-tetrahydrodipicolinate reductase
MITVGVIGAYGRMGSEVCRAVESANDMELGVRVGRNDELNELDAALVTVAVDFTTPDSVMGNIRWCLEHGIHLVIGTTGFDPSRLSGFPKWRPNVGVLVAPNFSIGAALMMRFAAVSAPHFESVEIVEMHHPDKTDAPSGTARRTAELVAAGRDGRRSPDATLGMNDSRGSDIQGVRVHAVRLAGLVAHQEVLLGGHGETLTLRHDSLSRESFMPGVLLGVRWVTAHPGLTVGLDEPLGLAR